MFGSGLTSRCLLRGYRIDVISFPRRHPSTDDCCVQSDWVIHGGRDFRLKLSQRYARILAWDELLIVVRTYKHRLAEVLFDLLLIVTAYFGAFSLRLDFKIDRARANTMIALLT